MKSKTLKDWRHDLPDFIMKEIKAKAIKWVKKRGKEKLKSDKEDSESTDGYVRGWNDGREELLADFEKFHNITEEDLSQGMTQEVPK